MKTSLLIHPFELGDAWISRAKRAGADILALHPVGGKHAIASLDDLLAKLGTDPFRRMIDSAHAAGLAVEYELHAASWLLPRTLFDAEPSLFRMNEKGDRTPDANLCVSNADALTLVSDRAALLAEQLYGSTHRFFFWMDDCKDCYCHCPLCLGLSPADQQTKFVNAVLAGVRRVFPDATVPYLAYFDCIEPPKKVVPDEGIFLEFAPFEEMMGRRDGRPPKVDEAGKLPALLSFFGVKNARVLGYWLDNSLFSDWCGTPKVFSPDREAFRQDVARYRSLGIDDLATFACYLGDDYTARYGEADLADFFAGC